MNVLSETDRVMCVLYVQTGLR